MALWKGYELWLRDFSSVSAFIALKRLQLVTLTYKTGAIMKFSFAFNFAFTKKTAAAYLKETFRFM